MKKSYLGNHLHTPHPKNTLGILNNSLLLSIFWVKNGGMKGTKKLDKKLSGPNGSEGKESVPFLATLCAILDHTRQMVINAQKQEIISMPC